MVGHYLSSPVLQLEGLVGGREVLEAISAQRPLLAFLREAGVSYYVGTDLKRTAQGCLLASEPAQAQRGGMHMTATLCDAPVYRFSIAGITTTIHDLRQLMSGAPVPAAHSVRPGRGGR
jgi:hypothetical protein